MIAMLLTRKLSFTTPWFNSTFSRNRSALIVHGLHKTATMFLYRFFKDVAEHLQIDFQSVHNPDRTKAPLNNRASTSFIRCPERSFSIDRSSPSYSQEIFHLFQVRDPRDILVSEYYSLGWLHSEQAWSDEEKGRRKKIQQLTIDQYVLSEPEISKYPLLNRFDALLKNADNPAVSIVKYETMVTDFAAWLADVLPILYLGKRKFVRYFNRRNKNEFSLDTPCDSHKRHITPGDHRKKLRPSTIAQLNKRYSKILDFLGYSN
jgi:hypothetical protein